MGKSKGSNPKKEAGNARKAEQAAQKEADKRVTDEVSEAQKWNKGTKGSDKKAAAEAKKEEAARKKAEKAALLAEEEASTPGRSQPKNNKQAQKKTRGLDLSQLDDTPDGPSNPGALNATGIDNALDALEITGKTNANIDRHPERRFPAAFAKFEARRLEEVKADKSMVGLRLDQRKHRIRKEFDKSDDNPFNQVHATHNATTDEMAEIAKSHKGKIEARLTT
ncbi:DUF1014 domain-containing protein [Zalerion maritima]|uniref:DUF1014 domain-containing protein n=1 Tax=Zalerion maritima TaxID=339359 RepID=A0AAD5WTE6_9PEZI|nr:DUF1014 domain-containing protein [Zalerion maritima]